MTEHPIWKIGLFNRINVNEAECIKCKEDGAFKYIFKLPYRNLKGLFAHVRSKIHKDTEICRYFEQLMAEQDRTGVSNWTELELTAFVEEISSRQELIFRRHRPVNPEIDLDAIWASVANACADRGFERFAGRTRKQLQCDLWGKKKKEVMERYENALAAGIDESRKWKDVSEKAKWERLIIEMCKNNGGEEETPNRKRPIEEQFLALANYQSNNNTKNGSNMDEIAQTSSNLGWPKHVKLEEEDLRLIPQASLFERLCPSNNNSTTNNYEIPTENHQQQNQNSSQNFSFKYSCREDVINEIFKQKIKLGLKWTEIAKIIGNSKEWTTAACLGKMQFNESEAEKMIEIFQLAPDAKQWLKSIPNRGGNTINCASTSNDPLLYRFQEVFNIYGDALKELINEQFGDGIMSAVDFQIDLQKELCNEGRLSSPEKS
uniref:Cyanate lyase C-terminal domain-containing protein n=1 Tax=Meloidogyne floridensis TaxID=298350 RepID=A0A915P3S9_9BILA